MHEHYYDYNKKMISCQTDDKIFTVYACTGCTLYLIDVFDKGNNMGRSSSDHYADELKKFLDKINF